MANKNPEKIKLLQEYVTSTNDAFLVKSDWGTKVWIAKSSLSHWEIISEEDARYVEFVIPYWMAKKNGLI